MLNKEEVLVSLSRVQDPDLGKDLVTLGMIQDLRIDNGEIHFKVNLTTPACPLKEKIKQDCLNAIKEDHGDVVVEIEMIAEVTSVRSSETVLPGVKNIIAVASGKGGVGKSTVAVNLALGLARSGASVGLIDADIYGPSIPTMFNLENQRPGLKEIDGKQYIIPIEKHGLKLLSIGFLVDEAKAVVWRGPMASSALKQFVNDTLWGDLDYLIFDMPPGTSDIHLTLVQSVPVTGAVVVTTPQKVALADAKKAISMFGLPSVNVPVLGLIENMAWFTPAELPDNKYYIFGDGGGKSLAEELNIPLVGRIPLVQSIREGGDEGEPVIAKFEESVSADFMNMVQQVAQKVAIRNEELEPTKPVEVK